MSEYHYTVELNNEVVEDLYIHASPHGAFVQAMDAAESHEKNGNIRLFQHVNGKKIPIYFSEKGFV